MSRQDLTWFKRNLKNDVFCLSVFKVLIYRLKPYEIISNSVCGSCPVYDSVVKRLSRQVVALKNASSNLVGIATRKLGFMPLKRSPLKEPNDTVGILGVGSMIL